MSTIPAVVVSDSRSRVSRYLLVALLVVISGLFLFVGGLKVLGAQEMHANMATLHYAAAATYLIGAIEIVAVVALWFRRTRLVSLAVLLLILAGAVGTHIAGGHGIGSTTMIWGFSLLIAAAIYLSGGRDLVRVLQGGKPESTTEG